MNDYEPRVAGESAAVVLAALQGGQMKPRPHGMTELKYSYRRESPEGKAFERALARMVGRLTTRDLLDEFTTGNATRNERQRRADAFFELVREATEALTPRVTSDAFTNRRPAPRGRQGS